MVGGGTSLWRGGGLGARLNHSLGRAQSRSPLFTRNWFMKLLAKFSLIFVVVFGAGLAAAGLLCHDLLQRNARQQVLYQAHLMMDSAAAVRHYTTEQVKPVLAGRAARDEAFRPQTVPAFAATEIFNNLRANHPDYSYKEATLNPTNPRDRAADWEADVIRIFRDRPADDRSLFDGERMT